ncbi:hypothetical protein NMY22_g9898 [Coprinellus aureogranulatus]|nr:hypothetical protein NMY22_g9898 [Coprinellus aureogranulatus]
MVSNGQPDEAADEQLSCSKAGAEIQVDMDGLDIGDLVQHLTDPARQQALALLYHGLPCKHVPEDSTSVRAVGSPCSLISLNMARAAFEIYKKTRTASEVGDTGTMALGAFNFFQELSDPTTLRDSCFAVEHDESRVLQPLGALIDEEPFKEAFNKVLLYYLPLSIEGFMRSLQLMWENAPHIPIVAGVIRFNEEAVLCLRVQVSSSSYTYIILDCHVRPGSCHRGPTFSIHKSRESAASYLHSRWKDHVATEDDEDSAEDFSVYILLHKQQAPSSPPWPEPQESSPANVDDTNASPPTPQPPQPEPEPAPSRKSKRDVIRNQASRNRLLSEFGWQMGLQDELSTLSSPTEATESSNQPQGGVSAAEEHPHSSLHQACEDPGAAAHTPPTKPRFPRSDFFKKDIGWQLALQEQVGALTTPLRAAEDAPVTKGHKSQKSMGQSSSVTNFSMKSGGSSLTLPRTPQASSSQAEIERQKPVRADIGVSTRRRTQPE